MGWRLGVTVSKKRFFKDLYAEIEDDNVFNGAAALAYYLLLAIIPGMIFLLSLLPYLPIQNLHQAVMDFVAQGLPGDAAKTIEGTIAEVTQQKRSGLLSFGALLTLWAASSGMYAIMQQLNITYDVKESRPFWKARGTAIVLTILFAVLVVGSFALIVAGGFLQEWLSNSLGWGAPLLFAFALFRWVVIAFLMLTGFALIYYFGPDVEQQFKFITPGSVAGVMSLVIASLAFRFYVENFGNYSATYGSLGAVIILMLWLYIAGLVILFGSEVNALAEHYAPDGKQKGEKKQPANARGRKPGFWPPPSPHEAYRTQPEPPKTKLGGLLDKGSLVLGLAAFALAARRQK